MRRGTSTSSIGPYPVSSIHDIAAGQPDECVGLLQNTFATTSFEAVAPLPGYRQWLRRQDGRLSYGDFKQQLQLLQWRDERHHWVLKSPFHLVELDALLDVFPNAAIIQVHREPGTAIPSFCSLLQTIYQLSCKSPDSIVLGASVLDLFAVAAEAALTVRQQTGSDRFFDISYRDLLANPLVQIERIYDWQQFPLSAEAKRHMTAWLKLNPQNAKGIHLYQPAAFGLEKAVIEKRFAAYRDSYTRFL